MGSGVQQIVSATKTLATRHQSRRSGLRTPKKRLGCKQLKKQRQKKKK